MSGVRDTLQGLVGTRLDEQFAEATRLDAKGSHKEALEQIDHYIARNPDDRGAHAMRIMILEHMEDLDEAIRHMEHLWNPDTADARIMFERARQYARAGRKAEAISYVRMAARRAKAEGWSRADRRHNRAEILFDLVNSGHTEMTDAALSHLRAACRLDNERLEAHAYIADLLFSKYNAGGFSDESLAKRGLSHGKMAVKLGMRDGVGELLYNMGWAYNLLGMTDMACRYLKKSIKARPDSATHILLGVCIWRTKDRTPKHYRTAIRHLDEALRLDPSCDEALKFKAEILVYLDDVSGARQAAEEFARRRPADTEAWQDLGYIAMVEGDFDRAAILIKKAKGLDSKAS